MILRERIRTARIAAKLSQSQLEGSTGILREYLSKLENNKLKNPTINTLTKIANGFSGDLLAGGKCQQKVSK